MLAQTYSLTHIGALTQAVNVETDVYNGLPGMSIVGLASKSIDEARDRIRSAIRNSGLQFPPRKVTINLAPADLVKAGTGYDLAIAVGLLIATQQIPQPEGRLCLIAELGLNGELRPTANTYASVLAAQDAGFTSIMIDPLSLIDTNLCQDITVYRPKNLRQVYQHFNGEVLLSRWESTRNDPQSRHHRGPDFADISGLEDIKQALALAALGNHNLLLVGPPGVGKSLAVSALPNILPTASDQERRSIHFLYSLANQEPPVTPSFRPFRSPHHTSSTIALTGGGAHPKPGEVSLAHHGVLFLDEIAEFPRATLEALRQPLETGEIAIARAAESAIFPAQITLIGAMNPCPCGYFQSLHRICNCSNSAIKRYQQKLSGPLLDRFDMVCWVQAPQPQSNHQNAVNKSSLEFAKQVQDASEKQFKGAINQAAEKALNTYTSQAKPSYRRQQKVRQLAATIARLNNHNQITTEHIHQAIYYQQPLMQGDHSLLSGFGS